VKLYGEEGVVGVKVGRRWWKDISEEDECDGGEGRRDEEQTVRGKGKGKAKAKAGGQGFWMRKGGLKGRGEAEA
jgi:hypothetical protein